MKKYLSVVIVDNGRRRFLKEAVSSALTQTLERDLYEVLVVLNYEDDDVRSMLAAEGLTPILVRKSNGGALYAAGIEEAQGEVIAFLDDDDMFDSKKLQKIYEVFQKDSNLGYYHNNFKLIDEQGRPIPCEAGNQHVQFVCNHRYEGFLYARTRAEKYSVIERVTHGMPLKDPFSRLAFNSSSIAVRRELALEYLDELARMNFAQDHLHFLEALKSNYAITHDPLSLTSYRVHSASFSFVKDYAYLGSKAFNDYSTIKHVGERYLAEMGIDLDVCESAYWRPIFYYAISKRDAPLVAIAAKGMLKKLVKSRLNRLRYRFLSAIGKMQSGKDAAEG